MDDEGYRNSNKRPDWCPLIELPPHGDLIDRNHLEALNLSLTDLYMRLKIYEDAEAEGRLLVLPCKVGDVLHRIYSMNHIEEDRAMGFLVSASGVWYWDENYRETPIEKIGKTVFLTREEAEAAMKEANDG